MIKFGLSCTIVHIWLGNIHTFMDMDAIEYISHRDLFAFELTRLRKMQGHSKTSFAEMVGISRRYLIKLESGEANPTLEMIERVAAGLGVGPQDLLDFERIARNKELYDTGITLRRITS